ncbi:lysis protein [Erwinia amylovora]|uniref:lysis protein n=1 Tax=Erwinia amylovora TaxID=552 RepID=UPI0018D64B8D|nr:lysis protein [Erwinia amylovora]
MMLTLLTRYWKPLVMSLLVAFLFFGGWWCGGITTTKAWELKWFQRDAADAKAIARREQAEREDSQRRQRDIAALDDKYTGELADAKAVIDKLQSDVAAGRKRLQINARCVQQSSTGTASMDDAAPARLTDAAQRDYFTLRQRIETSSKMIAGLQDYIRASQSRILNGD